MPHPLRSKRVIALLILLAGLFLAISVSVAGGFLDFLVEDGRIDRKPAIACLATYWAVSSLGVLILGYARYLREFLLFFGSVIMAVGLSEAVLRFVSPPWAMQRLRGVSSRTYHHLYPPERSMFMASTTATRLSSGRTRTGCEAVIPVRNSESTVIACSLSAILSCLVMEFVRTAASL
jgi:hypothetical protein